MLCCLLSACTSVLSVTQDDPETGSTAVAEEPLSPGTTGTSGSVPPPSAGLVSSEASEVWLAGSHAVCNGGSSYERSIPVDPQRFADSAVYVLAVPSAFGEAEEGWLLFPGVTGEGFVALESQDLSQRDLFNVGLLGNSANARGGVDLMDTLDGIDDGAEPHMYRLHGRTMSSRSKDQQIPILEALAGAGHVELTIGADQVPSSVIMVVCAREGLIEPHQAGCTNQSPPISSSLAKLNQAKDGILASVAAGDFDGDGLFDEVSVWVGDWEDPPAISVTTGAGGFLTTSELPIFPFGVAPVRMVGHETEMIFGYFTTMHAHAWGVLGIQDCELVYIGPDPEIAVTGDGYSNQWQVCLDEGDGGTILTTMDRSDGAELSDATDGGGSTPTFDNRYSWIMQDGELVETDLVPHDWDDDTCWN